MTITVYTTQIQWKSVSSEDYRRKDFLDITVKSGDKVFAPTWSMVMSHKDGKMTDAEYTDLYMELMRRTYKINPARWTWLLNQESITLACYCPPGDFCHRILLKDIIKTICKNRNTPFIDGGEI